MNKRIFVLIFVLLMPILASCQEKTTSSENPYISSNDVTNFVQFTMEDDKVFVVELNPEEAPITVKNFQDLVGKGFYNGLTFHRIEKDFVIQGGDPEGTGRGGPGHYIVGEFAANGIQNNIKHKQGTLSMARAQPFDSAGSQFFICLQDETAGHLDNQYAGFGQVVFGLEQVLQIEKDYLEKPDTPVMETVAFVQPK